jgi:hypothetical protein
MTARGTPKPKGIRRFERWLVGIAMAVVAFVLERIVVRSVRKKHGASVTEQPPSTVTSKGAEVDLE